MSSAAGEDRLDDVVEGDDVLGGEDDELDADELDADELDDDDDGFQGDYEAGDVNTVVGADYEAGDVNTVSTARRGATGNRGAVQAGGEIPLGVLDYLARSLADDPEAVVIRREQRRGSVVLKLHVAPSDMGRVIGRRGRTAQAIRTLVGVAGARDGVQTLVDIVDD
jgi:uncharacterized protein